MRQLIRSFALILLLVPISYAKSQVDFLLDRGVAQFQKQNYDEAKKDFQTILDLDPQGPDAEQAKFYIAECNRLRKQPVVTKRVLKMKPATTHGQIVSPGEKPPAVTLEESQKQLSSTSTRVAP